MILGADMFIGTRFLWTINSCWLFKDLLVISYADEHHDPGFCY